MLGASSICVINEGLLVGVLTRIDLFRIEAELINDAEFMKNAQMQGDEEGRADGEGSQGSSPIHFTSGAYRPPKHV
jgi:hypothetical protein